MSNTINWGKIHYNSWSPETNLTGAGATPSFSNTKSTEYDGIDAYVDIGAPSNLNSVTTMSISCWFKTTLATGVLVGADDQSLGRRFILQVISSKVRFVYFNSSVQFYFAISTTNVNDGNWHNVVSVLDGTSIKVYVDGVLEGTATGVGNMNANINTPINIGRRSYATSKLAFQGNIDETSIFNTALTQIEVTSIYNGGVPNNLNDLSTPPLSWWRFEGTGTTAIDSGSGGNDGTLENTAIRSTDVPT
jgi:hypothetical protein